MKNCVVFKNEQSDGYQQKESLSFVPVCDDCLNNPAILFEGEASSTSNEEGEACFFCHKTIED